MGPGDASRTGIRLGKEYPHVRGGECETDMSVRLFALTCGRLRGDLGYLMEGGEGQVELPIPVYLIETPKGTVVFDTGLHPDCQRDPAARVGARITGLFSFDFRQGEEISARLR